MIAAAGCGGGDDGGTQPSDGAPVSSDAAVVSDAAPVADAGCGAEPTCEGVCALQPPTCQGGAWVCDGDGYEPEETSCDGFDNDCDGTVDEGVCTACQPSARVADNLNAIWDIDFAYDCTTFLTSLISGPDFTTVVPVDDGAPIQTFFGNTNQNMGYALVDPAPDRQRVVAVYACCPTCGCMSQNGLTLLYTCDAEEPGCGCAGETNCPGFLDEPFLAAGELETSESFNSITVATPNGLAVGPGSSYYVGNFAPATCSDEAGCVACDPAHPGSVCTPSQPACCDTTPLGRLVRFTLPDEGVEPTWRVVHIFDGEEIFGLTSGRDGSIWVGTRTTAGAGNLYRYDPAAGTAALVRAYEATVFSVTQNRANGDFYLEVRASPKLRRLAEDGSELSLPAGVPADPAEQGVLQMGPDGRLYRLIGRVMSASTLDSYSVD